MDESTRTTIQAMGLAMDRMSHISMNIANAQTPGYKRTQAVARPFGQLVAQATAQTASPAPQPIVDHRAGSVRQTGRSLDIALAAGHFLEVTTPAGPAFIRGGSLQLDARGRLSTAAGQPVVGGSGDITLPGPDVRIDAAGRILAQDKEIGQLKVVRFEDLSVLQRDSAGSYRTNVNGSPATSDAVKPGYLENSNTDVMREMVAMVETVRHFESLQKNLQGQDSMLQTAVRTLGGL